MGSDESKIVATVGGSLTALYSTVGFAANVGTKVITNNVAAVCERKRKNLKVGRAIVAEVACVIGFGLLLGGLYCCTTGTIPLVITSVAVGLTILPALYLTILRPLSLTDWGVRLCMST